MGRTVQATAARPLPTRPARLMLIGVGPGHPLAASLAGAVGETAEGLVDPVRRGECSQEDLAVGVFGLDDREHRRQFAEWPRTFGTRALAVAIGGQRVVLGPLAVPGRVGCGRCALDRMEAAGGGRWTPRPRPAPEAEAIAGAAAPNGVVGTPPAVADILGPLLAEEVGAILQHADYGTRLLDHVCSVDWRGRVATLHRVVPLARCPVCGGAVKLDAGSIRAPEVRLDPDPERLLAALAGWIDPLTGVVPALTVDRPAREAAGLPLVVTAAPPHVVAEDGSLRRLPVGWGKGLSLSAAILSAVGEAIERYAASHPEATRIVWRRPDELDGERLDPRSFALYADEQYSLDAFPYVPFDPDRPHPWVMGRWLGGGGPVWVPAIFAFLSLRLGREQLICQGTSNGLAAGASFEDAALRATLELLERDAFLIAWRARLPGVRVRPDQTLAPELRRVLAAVERLGGSIELHLLPTAACGTTALCLALGDGKRWPGVTLGLGADLDPRRALRQAILELGQTGPHLARLMRSGELPIPADPDQVRGLLDHAAYYFPAWRAPAFDNLRQSSQTVSLSELSPVAAEASLARCAETLAAHRVRVALVDVSSPDVATGPFRVVRAVSPDLQPLTYGHGLDRLPVPRLLEAGPSRDTPPIHPIW